MSEITGATISWTDYVSAETPRILNIPLAWGDADAQDIWDTLSAEAAKLDNLIYKKLLDRAKGGGKSTIGVGKATGITVPMNNIQIMFEPQLSIAEAGTVTTPDAAGQTLNDSTALFVTNSVARGDVAENDTDGSHATVLRVASETQIITSPLLGGIDNEWGSADSYDILSWTRRAVTEGDVISQDYLEAPQPAVITSYGILPTIELSTSPALSISSGVPQKAVALPNFKFLLVLASDHVTGATGKTPTCEIQKDDGSFATCDNAAVEIAHGMYRVDLTATEMDADNILLRFSEAASDDRFVEIVTG